MLRKYVVEKQLKDVDAENIHIKNDSSKEEYNCLVRWYHDKAYTVRQINSAKTFVIPSACHEMHDRATLGGFQFYSLLDIVTVRKKGWNDAFG